MQVVVLADTGLREELLAQGVNEPLELKWLNNIEQLKGLSNADAFIDLSFEPDPKRIVLLKQLLPRPVLVNSVVTTLKDLPENIVRFNGWPTFLKRNTLESSCNNGSIKKRTEEIFALLNKKVEWVADEPGFITARIIAMIINEAYFALGEGISTKNEMDIAMKLGTNYPYGPFEWAEKIGVKRIFALLNELSKENNRFQAAEWLTKETRI
ncbi:MAG TPA: 3-hydroxyacyl-CoA dehydrogenase family protein [Chitinophagaceae bacterium]|jgi:3-hydroxybutyryl-CoA dehydrogenase|nr:3-hydroxyacyl-CoA dehydrogenase family protein [Chitinophagaceae bacterium]